MVPLVDAFGETFGREAALAVWSDRWERLHLGRSGRENVTMGGEPIGRLAFIFFPVGFVSEVKDLYFNTIWEAAFSSGKFLDRSRASPSENSGVACVFFMHPFANEFEIFYGLLHANDAHWIASA